MYPPTWGWPLRRPRPYAMLWAMWNALNRPEIDPADASYSEARRRILVRLGHYAALLVGPLNLRPRAATIHANDNQRIEVRISTPTSHILLIIAPERDLAPEVAWLRALAALNLPIPRLIAHDLTCGTVPFTYAIEGYVSGTPLDRLDDGPHMRVLARQLGRTLRRAHQVAAAGFGRPTVAGRWPARGWPEALRAWLAYDETWAHAAELLGAEALAALCAATIEHPALACERAYVLHGQVEPSRVYATLGDTTQIEALTRPGELIGGDPLFDLAHALLPRHPAAFRQGLREGYTAMGQLAPDQEARLRRLSLLVHVADTIRYGAAPALAALPAAVAAELQVLATP